MLYVLYTYFCVCTGKQWGLTGHTENDAISREGEWGLGMVKVKFSFL